MRISIGAPGFVPDGAGSPNDRNEELAMGVALQLVCDGSVSLALQLAKRGGSVSLALQLVCGGADVAGVGTTGRSAVQS